MIRPYKVGNSRCVDFAKWQREMKLTITYVVCISMVVELAGGGSANEVDKHFLHHFPFFGCKCVRMTQQISDPGVDALLQISVHISAVLLNHWTESDSHSCLQALEVCHTYNWSLIVKKKLVIIIQIFLSFIISSSISLPLSILLLVWLLF